MEWEYKTVALEDFISEWQELSITEQLNKYGEEGWELASIYEPKAQSYGRPNKLDERFMVFKRPKKV